MQSNLKLISARISPETLDAIDVFLKKRSYMTRNQVINMVLTAVFRNFNDRQIYEMSTLNTLKKEPYIVEFKRVDLLHPGNTENEHESE